MDEIPKTTKNSVKEVSKVSMQNESVVFSFVNIILS